MAEVQKELEFSKALVFGPHPDDAEFMAGGTIAKWTSEGKEVVLCVVTNGAAGSNDPEVARDWLIETRRKEQQAAAEVLGISEVVWLGYEDGYVEDSHELRRDMIREMRRHKPEVVLGPDPATFYFEHRYINHPDHRHTGEAFLAAVTPGVTTTPLYRAELHDKGFEPHSLKACLLGMSSRGDYYVDITDFMEHKIAALTAHDSQVGDWPDVGKRVQEMSAGIAKASGRPFTYAEVFKAFFFS
jgi:LmbE family N-acetylglucosaminyl deacetylase